MILEEKGEMTQTEIESTETMGNTFSKTYERTVEELSSMVYVNPNKVINAKANSIFNVKSPYYHFN